MAVITILLAVDSDGVVDRGDEYDDTYDAPLLITCWLWW